MKEVVDRIVQYPNRYKLTDVSTGQDLGTYDFTEVPGTVQQEGTEINAELFNSIEQDIEAAGNFDPNGTYPNLTAGKATHAQSADTATSAASATDAVNAQLAVKATRDAAGNNIQSTYATKTDLNTKANQTALDGVINGTTPVARATAADSATNATQDGQGRNIAETYALKSEVGGKLYRQYVQVTLAESGANIDGYASASIYTSYKTPITEEKFCNLNGIPVKLNIIGQSTKIGFLSNRSTLKKLYIDVVGEESKYYRYIGGLTVSVAEA